MVFDWFYHPGWFVNRRRRAEAGFPAMQNLHVFTVPLQCPYSALTVPLQFPYVKHTVPLPYLGQGKGHPHLLFQSPVW